MKHYTSGTPLFTIKAHDLGPIEIFAYTVGGLLVGGGMLLVIGHLQERPNQDKNFFLLGVVFLIAVTATTISLYSYIFIDHIQSEIATLVCGVMLV